MMGRMSSKHERLVGPPSGPHAVEDLGEGHNAAMWAVTIIGIIAAAVGTWGVITLSAVLGIIAVVLAVVAVIVGVVLTKMGHGAYTYGKGDTPSDKHAVGIK